MLAKNVKWPKGAKMVLSLVVNYEEGGQYLLSEGDDHDETVGEFGPSPFATPPNMADVTNREVYEYGVRVGFWRLIDLFDRMGVKATFLCTGRALERHPETGGVITAKGHEPAGHGYTWREQWKMGEGEEREYIRRCVTSVKEQTGERPYGWLCRQPPSLNTERLLMEEGFLYTSDAFADEIPYYVDIGGKKFLKVPYNLDVNDMKMWLPVGFRTPAEYFSYLKDTFDFLYEEGERREGGGIMTVPLHMRITGRPGRTMALSKFIKYAKGFRNVWIARRLDIANWWLEHYPP